MRESVLSGLLCSPARTILLPAVSFAAVSGAEGNAVLHVVRTAGRQDGHIRPARKLASIRVSSRLLYTLGLVEIHVLPFSGQPSHLTSISSLAP